MGLKTIQVSFSANYIKSLDTLYTYQTDSDVKVGDLVTVEVNDGDLKVATVIIIDSKYNHRLLEDLKLNRFKTATK